MGEVWIKEETLTAIGDAVRAKTRASDLMSPDSMIAALDGVKSSGAYLFSKKETSDGDVIGYAVADDLAKYPDGGMQNGYYWERFVEKLDYSKITWADGTDEEIVAMIEAADRGEINLADYWTVGDTRTVSLSAMDATGVGESHAAQTVEFTLMHAGGYELNTAVESGRTTCSFIVGMKNCLNTKGYMNNTKTNSGSWNGSLRRTWCNSVFRNAIPSSIRNIFKQFKVTTAATYNGSTNQVSVDYFTLPAAKEIFGGTASSAGDATSYSNLTEFNSLFQYDWYKTASNRVKMVSESESRWWERSPSYSSSSSYCCLYVDGSMDTDLASFSNGLSPVGVI